MRYQMIVTNTALAEFCAAAAQAPVLALDTEFVRTSSLVPKIGLIQLNAGQGIALVDPLQITDWQPLAALLADPELIKLVHSCSEDLEALAAIGLTEIHSLFDTQLAVELIGWGTSVGYAKLVEQLTGQVLDKSESRTDWIARPLSETQLDYAANDVDFLLPLYPMILEKLPSPESKTLVLQEGRSMVERRQRQLPDQFRYLELKNSWQFNGRELALLQKFCAWRQQYAQQKDLALSLILKDAHLYELARRKPTSIEGLLQIEGLSGREVRRHGPLWLEMIRDCRQLPIEQCPQTFYHLQQFAGFKQVQQQLTDAIQAAVTKYGIPAGILSVKRLQNEYLNWCWRVRDEERDLLPVPDYLRPWRHAYLGEFLPKPEHVKPWLERAAQEFATVE